jgi:hypothetical protein
MMVVLDPPEPDSHLVIVDVKATDADGAVAAAWAAGARLQAALEDRRATGDREGWEELRAFQYETSPSERAVAVAHAARAGEACAWSSSTGPSRHSRSAARR